MINLKIDQVSIGNSYEFENQCGYSKVSKRLVYIRLKETKEKYRFFIYLDPKLKEWRPQQSNPIHASLECSICKEKGKKYDKGNMCNGLEIKDLEDIWNKVKNKGQVKFQLVHKLKMNKRTYGYRTL